MIGRMLDFSIANVNERERIPLEAIQRVVDRIAEKREETLQTIQDQVSGRVNHAPPAGWDRGSCIQLE